MKKAILAVSFGTSHHDTLAKTIAALEADLGNAFSERPVFRAFTSGMIIRAVKTRDGINIDDVPAAMRRLIDASVQDLIIQPTHILNGDEHEKLLAQVEPFLASFERVVFGAPLLTSVEDYMETAQALVKTLPEKREDTAILFMGHGTEHYSNAAYAQMEYIFHDMARDDVVFGTVEGYPGFEEALRRLNERPQVKKVELYPFMIVAGDHAKNDMSCDEPDSWKSVLEREGYEVSCHLVGLGEFSEIRNIFTAHARAAINSAEG